MRPVATKRAPRAIPGVARVAGGRQGLTPDEINAAIAAQGGLCILCRRPLGPHFAVDHDHELAKTHGHLERVGCKRCFRGVLDHRCNSLLGWGREDPAFFERAAAYIKLARGLAPSAPSVTPGATFGNTCTCPNGPMPGHYVGCPLAGAFGLPRPPA